MALGNCIGQTRLLGIFRHETRLGRDGTYCHENTRGYSEAALA